MTPDKLKYPAFAGLSQYKTTNGVSSAIFILGRPGRSSESEVTIVPRCLVQLLSWVFATVEKRNFERKIFFNGLRA